MNVLVEVPQSYSHQRNLEFDQTRYITETHGHESVDLEMVILLSWVCAIYEEKGHAIMDCPCVPFHIRVSIAKHVELHNMVGTIMDQP